MGSKPLTTKDIANFGKMLSKKRNLSAPNNNVRNSSFFFTAKSKKVCSFEENYTQ